MRFLTFCFISLTLTSFPLLGEIFQSNNLLPIEEAVEKADSKTLIIFDVLDTLITTEEPLFHNVNRQTFGRVFEKFSESIPKEKTDELMTVILNAVNTHLVDQRVFDLLNTVKERALNFVVLTSCRTGRYGLIEKMEEWRLEQLNSLGLNFENLSIREEKCYDSMQGPHGTPLVKKGVIFAAEIDKSIILEEFFKGQNWKFDKIIYVDDQLSNLLDVETFCLKHAIEFLGFEYTAVKDRPVPKIDEKLIEIQLNVLLNEGQWITHDQAAETFNDEC